jgi:hypothetical protein
VGPGPLGGGGCCGAKIKTTDTSDIDKGDDDSNAIDVFIAIVVLTLFVLSAGWQHVPCYRYVERSQSRHSYLHGSSISDGEDYIMRS